MNNLYTFAAACKGGSFLGFPTWYHYLNSQTDAQGNCAPVISSISDFWLIVAAIIEILLRVAAILAVAMVIYAGISFTTSQGDPEAAKRARNTLINALIGLAISVMAAAIVAFIAESISS